LDDTDQTQYEVEIKPKVYMQCEIDKANKEGFENKGNIKWYPISNKKVESSLKSNKKRKYVYMKLEREASNTIRHQLNACKRYILRTEKTTTNLRREDDKIKTNKHESDPRAGLFGKNKLVCCDNDDKWTNIGNEWYICHKLLYAMLDLAEAYYGESQVKVATLGIEPKDECRI
jgi:hypothetical protein